MILYEDPSGAATALAADLGERLERLGVYRRERRPWLSHVTVVALQGAGRTHSGGGEHTFFPCRPDCALLFVVATRWGAVRGT